MSLKLVRRPKSPNWIMRGTIRGQSVEETTGTSNKEAAEAIRVQRENQILTESIYGKKATVTFAEAALDYLEHGRGEKRFLKPLVDHFRTTVLRDIEQHALDVAAKKLYPRAGPATLNRQVYTPMAAILRHAARKGWCAIPTLERPKQPKGKVRWMKPYEADRLIDACAPHLRPLVVFMLYTGARAGEAVWLDWSNVDLIKRQVTFPKTKNGEPRSVPLHPRVVEELRKSNRRKGAVFVTHKGVPYERPDPDKDTDTSAGTRIGGAFFGACKRAGLGWTLPGKDGKPVFKTDITPHVCRHTWASWHYQANRDFTKLQELGGWKTLVMVMRYAHTNVETHSESINALPWGKSGDQIGKKPKKAA
ncbi:site-specific integrase [Mesorhizobium sp. M3A.F.Ca.ET.174.01.1.1]|uniref:tyrosine-type recombinase/integrase n=1 Tax=unclassified Mesorhizobium TaxID=325217 RepID=UPI001093F1C8|nr:MULTISPECIES: site-specific integrase [unclassified Mesorhizobium]TGS82746.1 site-specific integrase [Mesorhizobium sp. M3A.F.Ca.ET.175.01.1.1]TGT22701.1 site-specific integrase [Mesorhizobium sp. M3A.F.Ca.ET.174.01.1.1]